MKETIKPLDEPQGRGFPPTSFLLNWWMVGLGICILLLGGNLLYLRGYFSLVEIWTAAELYATYVVFSFVLGTAVLAFMILSAEPEPPIGRVALAGLGSGVVGILGLLFLENLPIATTVLPFDWLYGLALLCPLLAVFWVWLFGK